jgi:hypothetical protein
MERNELRVHRSSARLARFARTAVGSGLLLSLFAAGAQPAWADAHGAEVLARAREVERAQMQALAGTTMQMQTHGTVTEGSTAHTLDALRRLSVARDGSIQNDYVWGRFDGQSLDENALRKATGAPARPARQAETLTVALAPLSASDVDVVPVGAVGNGGYLMRCHIRRDAAVSNIEVVVDEASGKKRSAAMHPAGRLVKLADRADMLLTYASDGRPTELHSQFVAKILWIKRSADLTTTRLP